VGDKAALSPLCYAVHPR